MFNVVPFYLLAAAVLCYTVSMKKMTIRDIAKKAGVSVATVSYIINGRNAEKYTPETKKKVLQIINLYDYRPSRLAQAFASSKSRNIIAALDKQTTVFQKSEYLDFIRMLADALEKLQYNLLVKSHLETTRFDTADAIVCLGTEEDMFLRLAQENYVPMLTVDARVHDELFFQISQDFAEVKRRADQTFGRGNYSAVFVDTYNEALKTEIRAVFGDVLFLAGNGLADVPQGNIVTVNRVLTEIPLLSDRNFLLVPALTENRIRAVTDCFQKAVSKVEVAEHKIFV